MLNRRTIHSEGSVEEANQPNYNTSSPDHAYNNYSFMCIVSKCGMHQDSSQYVHASALLCHVMFWHCHCITLLAIHLLSHS